LILIYYREIYHKKQDEQDAELQELVKPSKKIHLEAAHEKKVNNEPNKSAVDAVSVILILLISKDFLD